VQTLPTSLTLGLLPGTYYESEETSQHKFYLDYDTKVSMNYNFSLPLQFGPDLLLSFRDTLSNMPDLLRDVMEKKDIYLVGNASSTMPVNLTFYVRMLDEEGKSLDIESDAGEIPGTDDPATPTESEYRVHMKASANAKKISKMEMQFIMEDGTGDCLNKDNYVKMDIKVAVPGGMDLEIK